MTELADRLAALATRDPDAARAAVDALTAPGDRALGEAVLAIYRNDPDAARHHAERARELGAGAPAAHYLAAAHAMRGDPERAIESARAAVVLDASPRSRASLGSLLLAGGHAEEAATVLRGVIADDPGHRDAHMNLATAAFQLADYGTAMAGYARAFELDPTDRAPIHNLMQMFAEIGKWLGAVAALELTREGTPPPGVGLALDLALDLANVELVELIASKFPRAAVHAGADQTVARLVAQATGRPPAMQLVIARALIDIDRHAEAGKLVHALARRGEPAIARDRGEPAMAKDRGEPLGAVDRGNLHHVEGLIAEHDRNPVRAIDRYVRALAADPSRVEAGVRASSLLLADASPEALGRIAALLDSVAPAERAMHPGLVFNEAIYLLRSDRAAEARTRLLQLLQLTGGEGSIAALARKALAELAPPDEAGATPV
jgi:tetratricopeptide (TPR) repeat protein